MPRVLRRIGLGAIAILLGLLVLTAAYAPGLWSELHFAAPFGLGETSFGSLRHQALDQPSIAKGTFPVVILMPGMGFSIPLYTTLAEHLASHGYIVAGLTPTAELAALRAAVAGWPARLRRWVVPCVRSRPRPNLRACRNGD